MRVGFDVSQIAHKGGVNTYTQKLAEQLSYLPNVEMVYLYSSLRVPYQGNLKNVKAYRLPPTLFEMLFNRWRSIPVETFIGSVDIFHSSDWTQPPSKAKKVTTYHDLVALKYPEWSHPKIIEVHKRKLKLVEREIDAIIAVSESTKRDLIEVSSIPADKITVIYEAPSANFKPQSEEKVKRFKEKYKLPERYALAIGGVGGRRNLNRIQEAAKDYNLVIAGVTLPWLSIEELELLYNAADVLMYCSLYEGFGIPILDAFSTGLPVITSNVSSMPEVGGDAALYVDPFNVEDIKNKLDQMMRDEQLKKEMIKKGFKQVKKFSWEKAAQQTLGVYEKLL